MLFNREKIGRNKINCFVPNNVNVFVDKLRKPLLTLSNFTDGRNCIFSDFRLTKKKRKNCLIIVIGALAAILMSQLHSVFV